MQGDYAARDEARGVSAALERISEVCCTLRGSEALMPGWCRSCEEGCHRCSESQLAAERLIQQRMIMYREYLTIANGAQNAVCAGGFTW